MHAELNLLGVYVSPFVGHLLLAAAPFLALRWLLARLGLLSRLWHPALAELSLFITILSLVAYT